MVKAKSETGHSGEAPIGAAPNFEAAQASLKEGVSKAMKYWEQTVAFGQGNFAAMMQASKISASGMQEISKTVVATQKTMIEESVSFTKSLLGAKSVKEAVEMQTSFAKASLEKAVTENKKIADASVKLVEQALAPVAEQLSKSVGQVKK